MTDRSLFDDPPDKPPHNGTDTSRLAAELAKPFVGKQRERVFEFIKSQGDHGATDEEIQTALKLTGNSERPRRHRLVEQYRVKESPNMRPTQAGRPATVWVACSTDQPPAVTSKANWRTNGKTNPNIAGSAEFVPDFSI